MCWSETATLAMIGLGAGATFVTFRRGDTAAIWGTLGYFTGMEALQAAGYLVIDQCGTPTNTTVTSLSYLHIAFQPLVINPFCMAIMGDAVDERMRRRVHALAALASALLLARLLPQAWFGACPPGSALCGQGFCTVSGDWHLGWKVPLNDLWGQFPLLGPGLSGQYPEYMLAVFVLPLAYGAWRFALFHLICGPILAHALTTDPNEMPAIWCLFSIGLLLIGLIPAIRRQFAPGATAA